MDKTEKLLTDILAELKKMNNRADRQESETLGRSNRADKLMEKALETLQEHNDGNL